MTQSTQTSLITEEVSCLEHLFRIFVCVCGVCLLGGGLLPSVQARLSLRFDSSPPLGSRGFRCIQVSLPEHTQALAFSAVVCGAQSLSASGQSVSIRGVSTDRHTAVAFVFLSRRSLCFFLLLNREDAAIYHCSVH